MEFDVNKFVRFDEKVGYCSNIVKTKIANAKFKEVEYALSKSDAIDFCALEEMADKSLYTTHIIKDKKLGKIGVAYTADTYMCYERKTKGGDDETNFAIAFVNQNCDIRIPKSITDDENNEYEVRYVYVFNRPSKLYIPESVRDVYVDAFAIDESESEICHIRPERFNERYIDFEITGNNEYLEVYNSGLYKKGRRTLIFQNDGTGFRLLWFYNSWDGQFAPEMEEIRPGALSYCRMEELVMPKKIKSFDMELAFGYDLYDDVKRIDFDGSIKKLVLSDNDKYTKCRYRINNDIDEVEISMPDGRVFDNDSLLGERVECFSAPKNHDKVEGKTIELTLAWANIIDNNKFRRRFDNVRHWKELCCINADFVAAIFPIDLKCYEDKKGTQLLLLGPWAKPYHDKTEQWPVVTVYEDYEFVKGQLKKAGWTE